jgi:hypothetical protein
MTALMLIYVFMLVAHPRSGLFSARTCAELVMLTLLLYAADTLPALQHGREAGAYSTDVKLR